jgi:hypothetical protein
MKSQLNKSNWMGVVLLFVLGGELPAGESTPPYISQLTTTDQELLQTLDNIAQGADLIKIALGASIASVILDANRPAVLSVSILTSDLDLAAKAMVDVRRIEACRSRQKIELHLVQETFSAGSTRQRFWRDLMNAFDKHCS